MSLGLSTCAIASGSVLLGVVEAMPDGGAPPESAAKVHMRLAFRYQLGKWTAICKGKESGKGNDGCQLEEPDDAREWSVIFNGKKLGMVDTQGWRDSIYHSFTGAQTISTNPIPEVLETTAPFSAWYGEATRRPLAAVAGEPSETSGPAWSREAPTSFDAAVVWPLFKSKVPLIPNCKFSDEGKALGSARKSTASDMVVFDRIALSSGGRLLGVRAKSDESCAEYGGYASDIWVMRPARGRAFALAGFPTNGWTYSLNLVDVGKFSGTGGEQALFYFAGYNEDGYVLYYDQFRKRVHFTWGYH